MIHDNVIQEAAEMLHRALMAHKAEIQEAFDNFEGDAKVSMSLRFRQLGDTVLIEYKVGGKTNAFEEKDGRNVVPKQAPLEFRKKA